MSSADKTTVRPTPLDDDDIRLARYENATGTPTISRTGLGRRFLRWRIAMQLYGLGPRRKDRTAYIFIGPPASGKSTYGESLARDIGAMVIDCDLAKERLPEYGNGRYASLVHEESDLIMDAVYLRTIRAGGNLVILLVGRNSQKIEDIQQELLGLDYKVHLRFVPLDAELAAERVVQRYRKRGRFVDPSYVLYGVSNKPQTTYDRLRYLGGWTSCETIEQK
ncbi:MAG: hypothetical protein EOP84_32970 [Verrucomicrobiaceae bacterium]|nr:MAG: hypothetical protein EOP84_32970 [Verrucomicrobiaceae bacterium]